MTRIARLRTALLPLLAIALLCPGCGDKRKTIVVPRPPVAPTLGKSWPNEDRRWWKYDLVRRFFEDTLRYYATPGEVPPLPNMPQLATLVANLPIGALYAADTATYQLKFNGYAYTGSGVYGQFLTESLFVSPAPFAASMALPVGRGTLLDEIVRLRPDLRRKLAARGGAPGFDAQFPRLPPLFLHGRVWEKATNSIGTYGDFDLLPTWTYLTSALTTGSEFTLQLARGLASDVFLHGRIMGQQTVATPAATYADALICFYALDYGVAEETDINGNSLGFYREFSYGTVAFVQNVGPVYCYQRDIVETGTPLTHGAIDQTIRLLATGLDLGP